MNTEYTYLKFPEYSSFLEYIGKHCINRDIGLVVWDLHPGPDSINYFVRLTKQLDTPKAIMLCDVKIYKGYISTKTAEEMTKLKNDKIDEIKKAAEKILGEPLSVIDAEYQLTPTGA